MVLHEDALLTVRRPPSRRLPRPLEVLHAIARRPFFLALAVAAITHLLWFLLLANSGGDIAAQDAWAEFARTNPDSAYDFAWYGGMHPVSYSAISPYLMATLGVRPTMVLVGVLASGLLALVLERVPGVRRPHLVAVYGAIALTGNAVSGRVTFGLGIVFALGAVALLSRAWAVRPLRRPTRWELAGVVALAGLATMSSPVAGLFLGFGAAGCWLSGRHSSAYALGLPPVVVVVASTVLFPFSGEEPMHVGSVILPLVCSVAIAGWAPFSWRAVRIAAAVNGIAVVAVWLIPTPIGTNVTRLALLFGGTVLVAILTSRVWAHRFAIGRLAVVAALITSTIWQVTQAVEDGVNERPPLAWTTGLNPLLGHLQALDVHLGRVEVVPVRSHREASALSGYVNLARGWNRQSDVRLNPLFYGQARLTATSYRRWLNRWAVRYIVLPQPPYDPAGGVREAALLARGLPYLTPVWSNASWQLFRVDHPAPLVEGPATVVRFDAGELVLQVTQPSDITLRVPASPWLTLTRAGGKALKTPHAGQNLSCLTRTTLATDAPPSAVSWEVLRATHSGTFRIRAPYKLPRGTPCPSPGS